MTPAYRFLLRLLPRERRARYGAEMAEVFADARRETYLRAGVFGVSVLWMKEAVGLARFSLRERLAGLRARFAPSQPGGGRHRFTTDLRWAWRGVRARGWRAGLVIGLLAIALAANTLLYSIADSLVFRRVPYRDAERLMTFQMISQARDQWSGWPVSAEWLERLRQRSDLFESVHGYSAGRSTFVVDRQASAQETTAFVTPGLIEMLGARPAWGRSLSDADAVDRERRVVVISEILARERFGTPTAALGQRLETSEDPLVVVGVMPETFAFPNGRERIWRPLDYRSLTGARMTPIIRLQENAADQIAPALGDFARQLGDRLVFGPGTRIELTPLDSAMFGDSERRLTLMLLAAGLSLLLIACANVASLELAHAVTRSHIYAVQLALGGSRSRLLQAALLEGAWLIGGAIVIAGFLAWLSVDALALWLPQSEMRRTSNPLHIDFRALAYMATIAGATWMAAALPVAMFSSRANVLDVMKSEGRTAAGSRRTTTARRLLTAAQTALAVCLLVSGALYVRTYASLLGIDKGFESPNVVKIGLSLPVTYAVPGASAPLNEQVTNRLSARSDVRAFSRIFSTPFDTTTTIYSRPQVDGGPPSAEEFEFSRREIDEHFFDTLQPRIEGGRRLIASDLPENVLIAPSLAARLWPGMNPIGHQFRLTPQSPWLTVIGVMQHIRYTSETPIRPRSLTLTDRISEIYSMRQPPRPPASSPAAPSSATAPPVISPSAAAPAPRPNAPWSDVSFRFLTYAVRLDPRASIPDLVKDMRSIDHRFQLTIAPIDADYASAVADKQLAARIVTIFGLLAALVAIAGLYGVMAFVVASRTRELGIRLALGAAGRDVSRLVLQSGLQLILAGVAVGLVAAGLISHWIRSEFYGVSPFDPLSYTIVATVITLVCTLAMWQPARQAARVDPAVTLRTE